MKWPKSNTKRRAGVGLAVIAAAGCLATSIFLVAGNASAENAAPAAAKAEKKKLSGSDLYAMHCNRCHPERYATERTAKEWKTIMLHMRVRANLPAEQAKAILKYLQEDSGK